MNSRTSSPAFAAFKSKYQRRGEDIEAKREELQRLKALVDECEKELRLVTDVPSQEGM